jgi:hypothetical protein
MPAYRERMPIAPRPVRTWLWTGSIPAVAVTVHVFLIVAHILSFIIRGGVARGLPASFPRCQDADHQTCHAREEHGRCTREVLHDRQPSERGRHRPPADHLRYTHASCDARAAWTLVDQTSISCVNSDRTRPGGSALRPTDSKPLPALNRAICHLSRILIPATPLPGRDRPFRQRSRRAFGEGQALRYCPSLSIGRSESGQMPRYQKA